MGIAIARYISKQLEAGNYQFIASIASVKTIVLNFKNYSYCLSVASWPVKSGF